MLEGVRILAVHHDPGRNGAALLFQSVLEGLVHDHGAIVSMTVPRDGPLVARAQALGPVRVVPVRPASRTFASRVARRLRRRVPQKRERKYDLIFANSAASLGAVEKMLPGSEIPLAVYVHESGYLLQHAGDFAATTRLLRRAAVIFAATPLVRDTIEDLVRPTAKIVIASPFVPVRPITDATSDMPTDVRA
ncbi:MAG: hypothetical protein QOG30_678, partial [Acidimicrobiaceae bacterium]